MAQGYVQLPDDSSNTGKKEDHFITATAAQYREAVVVADPSTDAAVSKVTNAAPGQTDYGLVVRDPILGAQADDKSTATNTTPISAVSIWKQISASVQSLVSGAATLESGRNPVNTISGQAGVAAGDGSSSAGTQRVTVANDRLGTVLEITPVMDTSIYATGDVAFIPIEITSAAHHASGSLEVRSIVALDEDDQGVAITLYFQKDNSSMGSVNASFAPTDANARAITGKVVISTSDWEDLGANRVAVMDNVGQKIKADSNGSIWLSGAIRSGTPTFTASGLKLKIGVAWD